MFVTYTVASADNNRNPPTNATTNPIHFHASRSSDSSTAVCRRAPTPINRKSTVRLVPSHIDRPTKCSHSTTGYIHEEVRIVTPQDVLSSHVQQASTTSYMPAYFLDSSRSTGLATWLLYSANSLGEQSSSGMSKSSGSLCRISLLVACTGSVYITGSVNFIENSIASAETRWNVSSTFNCSLCGRPAWSSHVLASIDRKSTRLNSSH